MNRNFEALAEALDLSAKKSKPLGEFVPRFVFERGGKGKNGYGRLKVLMLNNDKGRLKKFQTAFYDGG